MNQCITVIILLFFGYQAILAVQFSIEIRMRIRRDNVALEKRQAHLLQNIKRIVEQALLGVLIKTEHHGADHIDPAIDQSARLENILIDTIDFSLVLPGQALLGNRLDAGKYPLAPGRLHQLDRLFIVGDVQAHLRQPPFFQRDHLFQELVKPIQVTVWVVIPEHHHFAIAPADIGSGCLEFNLFDDFVDRTFEIFVTVKVLDRTIGTTIDASPRPNNDCRIIIVSGIQQVQAAEWDPLQ